MSTFIVPPPRTLAIALGANMPSVAGQPIQTLVSVRVLLKEAIYKWITVSVKKNITSSKISNEITFKWSPLFKTKPLGGPENQSDFINAVVLIDGPLIQSITPSEEAILNLFAKTRKIEEDLGRNRKNTNVPWGPRSIDIDLLAWGDLQIKTEKLVLPHPRLIERDFVAIPLATVLTNSKRKLLQLPPRKGWEE